MKLKPLVAASMVALASLSSQAADTNWGAHDLLELGGSAVSGLFLDTYSFTLTETSTVSSGVLTFGAIAPAAYGLYEADGTGLAAWTYGGTSSTNTLTLDAGTYYYSVFGLATGSAAYAISSAATAVPVPEPETYAMLLAGLGVVGFVARRRKGA
ncbi:MAG TPA: FxDxF family PEP-CTERM protein [Roseateles sp.]|nr:FxDxF family PEP-CTERM protein [Roseateles sp.]